jgi:uncharacterized protein YndB with AHSA1/START domain
MNRIVIERDFAAPVPKLFAYLSEHENLDALFPARVERVSDGTDGRRNGVGSARKLSFGGLLPFVETNTEVVDDELIRYRITKGTPLNHHRGEMRFSPRDGGGSHLRYEIEFGSRIPGLAAAVAAGTKRSIERGLAKVDAELA